MASNISDLDLQVKDNMIINVEPFINAMNSHKMNEDLLAYLETVLNFLKYSTLTNRDLLIEPITAKIIEHKNEVKNNQESLKEMKEYNDGLKDLSIITTKKEDNDSGKDIDYIAFTRPNKEVEVLACKDATTVSNFIKDNANSIATKSAEEIFHYFKEYIHIELDFQTNEELMKNNPEADKQAVRNDEISKMEELQQLEDFKNTYSLPFDVELTIDPYGERIYRIGDGLFKFKDKMGKRAMQVLQQPTMLLTIEEKVENEYVVDVEHKVEDTQEEIDLDNIRLIDEKEFIDLLYQKYDKGNELTEEEELEIYKFAAYIVMNIEEWYESNEFSEVVDEYFKNYMYRLEEKYDQRNFEGNEISPEQEKLVEDYREVKHLARRQVKILEFKPEERRAGVASAVIILEIIIIAIFVLSFISLDI